MNETILARHVRRTNRNLLLVNLLLVLAVVAVAIGANRYLYNVFAGPFEIGEDELFSITNPDAARRYYVTLEATEAVDTGFQEVTQRVSKYSRTVQSESVSASYLAAYLGDGDHFVLVKADPGASGTHFSGALSRMTSYERQFVDDMEQEYPGFKQSGIMPMYVLDAERNFKAPGYALAAALLALLALGLGNIVKALRRISEPDQHPALRGLQRYGVPRDVAAAIDADILGGSPLKVGSVTLGRSWLVSQSTFGVRTMHLNEIIWIYQKVTSQRVNFVPVGKTYAAIIVGEQGDPIELQLKQPAAEALLGEIARRVPWVVVGYSAEIEKLLRSNRAQLIQAVAQRRSQAMSQGQGPAQGAWAS